MNFGNLLQQAQQMQRKVNKAKKEFDEREFEFNSQDDLIVGKMKGNLSISELHIQDSLIQEDKENMEALLIATINQAIENVSKEREDTLNKVTNVITNQFQAIGWIECTTSSGSYFIGDTEYYAYDELYWFVTDEGLGQYVRSSAIRRNQGVVNLN